MSTNQRRRGERRTFGGGNEDCRSAHAPSHFPAHFASSLVTFSDQNACTYLLLTQDKDSSANYAQWISKNATHHSRRELHNTWTILASNALR